MALSIPLLSRNSLKRPYFELILQPVSCTFNIRRLCSLESQGSSVQSVCRKSHISKLLFRALRGVVHLSPKRLNLLWRTSYIRLFILLSLSRCKMMICGTGAYCIKFCILSPKHPRKWTGTRVGRQAEEREGVEKGGSGVMGMLDVHIVRKERT